MESKSYIDKINDFARGKTIEKIIGDIEGLMIYFTDGTSLKIKTFQYEITPK